MQLSDFVQHLVECKSQPLLGSSAQAHLTKNTFLTFVREKNTSATREKGGPHTILHGILGCGLYVP